MIRVCFALGTWQIATLAAGLRQSAHEDGGSDGGPGGGAAAHEDYLVLYEPAGASDALQSAMRSVAEAVWPWKRIVPAFDLLSVRRRLTQKTFGALLERVRERIGLSRADELWLCWLNRPTEKLILEAYGEARAVLYEDGLTTYLPVPVAEGFGERRRLPFPLGALARVGSRFTDALDERRPVRRFRRHKGRLDPRHRERLSDAYLVLADSLAVPEAFARASCHVVESRQLRETLDACGSLPNVSAGAAPLHRPGERHRVLVLGQSLYRWRVLSRDDELAVYRHIVAALLAKGYDILWKEHPRVQEPFFSQLAADTGPEGGGGATVGPPRMQEVDLPFALPVELVAGRMGLSACVAGISAALFYLPRLYDIPAYTFADDLAPFLVKQWRLQNEMVRDSVPALDTMPTAAMPPAAAAAAGGI